MATHISFLTSIGQVIEVCLLKMALFTHFEPYNVVTIVLVFSKINPKMNINEGGVPSYLLHPHARLRSKEKKAMQQIPLYSRFFFSNDGKPPGTI